MGQSILNGHLRKQSVPFESMEDFSPLIDSLKDKKIVMLGESSHGTSEYYEWRSKISRELIENHGFSFIAVEGDWPSCAHINSAIQNKIDEDPIKTLSHFSRWPTWMWANVETIGLMSWMSEWNKKGHSAGFHGLDVYSLYDSIHEVKKNLKRNHPELLGAVSEFYSCFDPYMHNEKAYIRSLFHLPEGCSEEVSEALESLLESKLKGHDFFDVVQNAKVIRNAEKYYRAMVTGEDSWNIRDHHMMETLERLLTQYGPEAKGIVWAHNTHIGDYRATDMVMNNQINLGGLARKSYGDDQVALVGFSTYAGTVIAASAWDGKTEVMKIPNAQIGSLESLLHGATPFVGAKQFYFQLKDLKEEELFKDYLGHRAIGVVYQPHYESRGNYVPTILSKRYDALIYFDHTSALTPLDIKFEIEKIPETYPFGARM
jgi:erythromycin esterase-like protein